MGLGSLSIGSFASYENTSSLVYFADLLRSVGGSMVPNAAGTALEDENAARRILRATPPAPPVLIAWYRGVSGPVDALC